MYSCAKQKAVYKKPSAKLKVTQVCFIGCVIIKKLNYTIDDFTYAKLCYLITYCQNYILRSTYSFTFRKQCVKKNKKVHNLGVYNQNYWCYLNY